MQSLHQMSLSLLPASLIEGLVLGVLCLSILVAFVVHTGINSLSRWEHKLTEWNRKKPEGWLASVSPQFLYTQLQTTADTMISGVPTVLCTIAFLLACVQLYGAFALLQPDAAYIELLLHIAQQAKVFIWVLVSVATIWLLQRFFNSEQKIQAWLAERIADQKVKTNVSTGQTDSAVVDLLHKLIDIGREQEVVNVQSLSKIENLLEKAAQPASMPAEAFAPLVAQGDRVVAAQEALLEVLERIDGRQTSTERNGPISPSTSADTSLTPLIQRVDVVQSKLQEHVTGQQSVLLSILQTIKDGQLSSASNAEKMHQEFRVLIAAIERKLAESIPRAQAPALAQVPNHTLPATPSKAPAHPLAQPSTAPVIKTEPSIYSYNSSQNFASDAVWPTYPSDAEENAHSPLQSSMPVMEASTGYESDPVYYNASEPVEHVAVPDMSHPLQKQVLTGTVTSQNPEVFGLLSDWRESYDTHMDKLLEASQINSAATKTISQIVFQQEQFLAKVVQHVSVLLDYSKISSNDQQKMVQLLEVISAATPMGAVNTSPAADSEQHQQLVQLLEMQQRTLATHQQSTHRDLQQLIALLEQMQTKELDQQYAQEDSVLHELIERLPEQLESIWQNHQTLEHTFLKEWLEQFAEQHRHDTPVHTAAPAPVQLSETVEQNIADLRSNVEQTSTYMVETLERIEQIIKPDENTSGIS